MKRSLRLDANAIGASIAQDKDFLYTFACYLSIVAVFINLVFLQLPLIGLIASIVYFMINAVFLGNAFFMKASLFSRFMFGVLVLIMILGFVGWVVMLVYDLDIPRLILVLAITTTLSSAFNRRMKTKDAT